MNNIRISFRRINRWAQGFVARRTKDTGLTPSQIQALRHIGYHKIMSQQELVEDMGVDKAAVTRLVAGLEERGYVIRTADPKDGRAKVIQATEEALQVKDDVIALEGAAGVLRRHGQAASACPGRPPQLLQPDRCWQKRGR